MVNPFKLKFRADASRRDDETAKEAVGVGGALHVYMSHG